MFWGLTLMLAVWYGHAQYTEAKEKAEAKKARAVQEAAKYAKTHPPQQRIIVPAERPWTFRTVEIQAEGLPVYLYQGWRGFTQGGAITITTPGGRVFKDRPGVTTDLGFQPDGMYIFRADPPGSQRQVQIYNRW
jgi:hypothetical protein